MSDSEIGAETSPMDEDDSGEEEEEEGDHDVDMPDTPAPSDDMRSSEGPSDDEEDEIVIAATADDDDDDDGAASGVVVVHEGDEDDVLPVAAVVVEEGPKQPRAPLKKKPGPRPKAHNNSANSKRKLTRSQVAREARDMLVHTVSRLPMAIADSHFVVRSFGRLDPPYASETNLFPVGFSCDRLEFSPAHGRALKMRCTILDGRKLREKQAELGKTVEAPDGPLFRIMWGEGVDDDGDATTDYPYNAFSQTEPRPEAGMRVRVRYDFDQYYTGTIIKAVEKEQNGQVEIEIQYDDGSTESAILPDKDIALYLPGSEDEAMEDGTIEFSDINGKPVSSVVATSPIKAWGKALIALGLIDEVTYDAGLLELEKARTTKQGEEDAKSNETNNEQDTEDVSPEEDKLRKTVESLKKKLEAVRKLDREAICNLSEARLSTNGPFLCNAFPNTPQAFSQVNSWLTTIIRKEKTKMGSTGNKKKIVTATGLLERNDTFFNPDIEALVEGQPGSENVDNYVFQAFRGGAVSSISEEWQQEAMSRKEERDKKQQQQQKQKAAPKAKPPNDKEREKKRQLREEQNSARKKQKQEEMDMKKRARAEERLARLSVQVDERLYKESCSQREKVIQAMAKSLFKENNRRRKAAELVTGQVVIENWSPSPPKASPDGVEVQKLSPLCSKYDEVVLKVWDFFTSYGESMKKWGYLTKIPSLEKLQEAIDALRDGVHEKRTATTTIDRKQAVRFLLKLCVSLCKPLAVSLTRLLFASLIALNPALQKDFGAAFFAEVRNILDGNEPKEENKDGPSAADLLQVDTWSWPEIARMSFLSDALGDLGYDKAQIAHQLRGYRSMGHPNSKEAKRLRKTEDFPISVLRQDIEQRARNSSYSVGVQARIMTPTTPSAQPDDWKFYLHNIKALSTKKIDLLKRNAKKSLELVELARSKGQKSLRSAVADIEKAISLFESVSDQGKMTQAEITVCNQGRMILLKLLDRTTGEVFSSDTAKELYTKGFINYNPQFPNGSSNQYDLDRPRVGLPKDLEINDHTYKIYTNKREAYMADALRLKEEMEMKEKIDEDDDEEDEDEEDNSGKADGTEKAQLKAEEVTETEPTSATDNEDSKKTNGSKDSAPEEVVATVVENGGDDGGKVDVSAEASKIGKVTPYDEFCGDIPTAPELIRRCLAVLRTITQTNSAEHFIYPVDPQTNPGYYESILQPMCLREIGLQLMKSAEQLSGQIDEKEKTKGAERTVTEFGRNMRMINRNCSCYANAGANIIAAGDELLRIFERLLFDWVLAPAHELPPLESLDDDKCVVYHKSDEDCLVLLCDGCEGKYNMARLDPPLAEVPRGDWYCPRCLSGRSWDMLDPRIGKVITNENGSSCTVENCHFVYPENRSESPHLVYQLKNELDERKSCRLEDLDALLLKQGTLVEPVRCLEALSESPGYSQGANRQLFENLVPILANPLVADAASHTYLSGSVYRDTMFSASSIRLVDPENMLASEWTTLLTLLVMKCSSSEMLLELATKVEGEAAERMSKLQGVGPKRIDIKDILHLPRQLASMDKAETEKNGDDANGKDAPMIVEAKAIEVVSGVKLEPNGDHALKNGSNIAPDVILSESVSRKQERAAALDEKERRQKLREEGLTAFVIKNQLRGTTASFEEDQVSEVVDNSLGSKERGLNLASSRCPGHTCAFCGLSDIGLGTPLMRVPDKKEWDELMPHLSRNRKVYLLASTVGLNVDSESERKRKTKKDLVILKLRIEGDLFSLNDSEEKTFDGINEGGIMTFLPRNDEGCQSELNFRATVDLPFVTGSLNAHECCAIAAHGARKEKVVQEFKEKKTRQAERISGRTCGRTLSIGKDLVGRSFWKFNAYPDSLFVCFEGQEQERIWNRYQHPEVVASVICSLGEDPLVRELKEAFPEASALIPHGKWRGAILKGHFEGVYCAGAEEEEKQKGSAEEGENEDDDYPFEAGEPVLVESKCSAALWDAKVIAVSKLEGKINGYRVHYRGWSTRFDEWVAKIRVVEPNENNVQVQLEMAEVHQENRFELLKNSGFVQKLKARRFIEAKHRSRGNVQPPDFSSILAVPKGRSSGQETFAMAKAGLLLIESALPMGAVDASPKGQWRPEYAAEWRKIVMTASGPYTLMACAYLLEESISPDWMNQHVIHVLSALPQRWKAIREASFASLALRVAMLDLAVDYETIDRARHTSKSRR